MPLKRRISLETCIECGACVSECPESAIAEFPYVIDPEACTNCGACDPACPVEAIEEFEWTPPDPLGPIPRGLAITIGLNLK